MTLSARHSRLQPAEKRRSPRRALKLERAKVEFGGTHYAAALNDLSPQGALVECSAPLTSGDNIVIDALTDQPLRAKVIWSKGQLFGCEFADVVSKAAISAALLKGAPKTARKPHTKLRQDDGVEQMPAGRGARIATVGGLGLLAWAPVAIAARALLG
jgi:hypothetical protein